VKIIFLLLLLLLTAGTGTATRRGRCRRPLPPHQADQETPPEPSRWRSHVWEGLTFVFGLASLVQLAFLFPFWHTRPEVAAPTEVDSASLVFPFAIGNKSVVFALPNHFVCGIDLLFFEDADGKAVVVRDLMYPQVVSVPPSTTIPYTCDGARLIHILPNGVLRVGTDKRWLDSRPGMLKPPISRIIKMCIWIGIGEYPSYRFHWPLARGTPRWAEDSTVEGVPDTEPVPAIEIAGVFGLRPLVDNARHLLPGALECSKNAQGPLMSFE
jgi:hypothetical protein